MMQTTQIINVFALALIHFTWIAAVIGIAVVAVRQLISPTAANAQWRYRLGIVGMLGMLLAIPLSTWLAWPAAQSTTIANRTTAEHHTTPFEQPESAITKSIVPKTSGQPIVAKSAPNRDAHSNETGSAIASTSQPSTQSDSAQATTGWNTILSSASPWIAAAYVVGLVLMLIRISWMLIGCRRILGQSTVISDPSLVDIIHRYARQFKLSRLPALATCQRVNSPVIVGIWKPVILIPTAMLSGLTTAEIEIVLWHELAHFRRHDPVMVFLQRSVETVLFFHPSVWWISRNLDRDREICCDEMVLETGASRIEYASVLCRVAEFAIAEPNRLAPAITGSSSPELVSRVGLILGDTTARNDWRRSWMVLSVAALSVLLCATLLLPKLPLSFATQVLTQGDQQSEQDNKQDEGKANNQEKSALQSKPQTEKDKYDISFRDFGRDYVRGYEVISKLLTEAEAADEPPEILAKLRYNAARAHRGIQRIKREETERDYSTANAILHEVVRNPQTYLVNTESGRWYRNCVVSLASTYDKVGQPKPVIDAVYQTAIEDINAAMKLDPRERFLLVNSLQVYRSDRAIEVEDWPAAIKLVQPVIEQVDEFLKDKRGAFDYSMAVRQQSMFLANDNQVKESVALIDATCKKLEQAQQIDEATRIGCLCMLRGKNLINFKREDHTELFDEGWKQYEALDKRARAYEEADRADVLYWCFNMNRLAMFVIPAEKIDQAEKTVRATMALIEADPKLLDPEARALSHLEDMTRGAVSSIREATKSSKRPSPPGAPPQDPAQQLQGDVKAFIAKYGKE